MTTNSNPAPLVAEVGASFAYGTKGVSRALLSFAVAKGLTVLEEDLVVHVAGARVEPTVVDGLHGTRLHQIDEVPDGWLEVSYRARVDLSVQPTSPQGTVADLERWTYTRPSRYAESDRLGPMAARTFPGLVGMELVTAVEEWAHHNLTYTSGSSRGTDGAVDTLLLGEGVCRDFAHVVVALLRGLGVPARLVSVYAPGLAPMDFHAVAEAWVDGAWHVVDATRLAPRQSMVRIGTGRDAADTAFLTTSGGVARYDRQRVTAAIVEGELPVDDPGVPVRLA
ncbi:transglutaminase family protein [Janibacter sp. GXQ6167]|uniref:transglutaminase-like domain-containing protein n=1 Tax=Janibacter sp. GXQ6167 TaxID=3240791 RepID=UPI0035252E4B